ncbi:MAG TPA: M20/M25/M40 family metallo-hydrolase, partial [Vineibacter sp.]|nr:M20/M25/M40 family metallo-hydrolase [Vineibacter sp.]
MTTLRRDPVDLLRTLIGAQRQGEAAVQRLVAEAAQALGCTVETVRYRPGDVPMVAEFASDRAIDLGERASVVARYKGRGAGRSVIFFAHPDGEPVAGLDAWQRDPFAGAVEGGRIYGWGVADDLSGVAILVEGLAAVLAAGQAPAGDVILASTPSKRHARGVAALLHGGLRADAAVYLHPAESGIGLREIKAFAPGMLEFRITVDGCPPDTNEISHAAFAHRAVNPLDKLWLVYRALQVLDAQRGARVRHPTLEAAIGRSTNLLVSRLSTEGETGLSRIAPRAVLTGCVTFPPQESLAGVQAELDAAVQGAAAGDDWLRQHPPRLQWLSGVAAAEVALEHPLYVTVAD